MFEALAMASSSGNSNSNSGSEDDLQQLLDQRKRKRMQSNRESARRSRMRKQKRMDDLVVQVSELRKENNQILSSINITAKHYMNVEAENSVLRAQMVELGHRLDSLNQILEFMNIAATAGFSEIDHASDPNLAETFIDPMNMGYLNQPIVASAEIYQY